MTDPPRWRLIGRDDEGIVVVDLDDRLEETARRRCTTAEWHALASATGSGTRWV